MWPCSVFYPLSLIAISVTSCCVGLSLRSRDSQSGNGSRNCEVVTSPKRSANGQRQGASSSDGDDDDATAARFCQMNCDSSSTLDHSSSRRAPARVPPVPPAPVNHLDQSQRCIQHHYPACNDGDERPDNVDRRRASAANSLMLSRSNSRSHIRPLRYHTDVGCSLSSSSYLPLARAPASLRTSRSAKTMAGGERRLERIERCVDMCLFVLLVLICVGFAVCLVFMSF